MRHSNETIQQILKLHSQGLSSRAISDIVFNRKSAKSSVNDIITRYKNITKDMGEITSMTNQYVETVTFTKSGGTHLVIPDTQVKPDVCIDHLKLLGKYIVHKQPDVIIHLGDHADMESLSSYDKGKKSAEGKRVNKDIEAARKGMEALLSPLRQLQKSQRERGEAVYKPRMVLTLGNHEDRINRHVDANPELHGFLSIDSLGYKQYGWEVYDFLKPVVVDGVAYCHFMSNPFSGKPYGGSAQNILSKVGESFTVGHKQTLDIATRFLPASGKQQWGIVAGAFYSHSEGYKGYQGNHHWRGFIVKHNVEDGSYNPMFVDIDYLEKKYGKVY